MPTEFTDGSPVWTDLMTSDLEGAKAFYGKLFGWTFRAVEEFGGYTIAHTDGTNQVAGLMSATDDEPANNWTVYLQVADAEATCAAASAAGGSVLYPAMAVGDLGSMAIITDGSAAVGLWEPKAHKGFEDIGHHGAIAWTELSTGRYEAAQEFYTTVFGYRYLTDESQNGPGYLTFQTPDSAPDGGSGGIFDHTGSVPPGTPDHWAVYWSVSDMAAAVATVHAEGGQVLVEPFEIPYGTMAVIADPFGAAVKLIQLSMEMNPSE